jgi:ABC-type dipeptide/oligopeptide/nickel transport system permease subunit
MIAVGRGVRPETPTRSSIIAAGQVSLSQAWWIRIFPGAALILIVLADPRLRDAV